MLGPSEKTRVWFRIQRNTESELTIEEGDLLTYLPPLSSWWHQQLGRRLEHDPTEAEVREEGLKRKSTFLICDGAPRGTRNGHIAWSSTNQNFDSERTGDDIVDENNRWAICLRLHDNHFSEFTEETATVDVTPRRCRYFAPRPGEIVHWENHDLSDPDAPRKIAEGDVRTHTHGLVTVPEFTVGRKGWGNRLLLTRRAHSEATPN